MAVILKRNDIDSVLICGQTGGSEGQDRQGYFQAMFNISTAYAQDASVRYSSYLPKRK